MIYLRILVTTERKAFLFNLDTLDLIDSIDTVLNPNGFIYY